MNFLLHNTIFDNIINIFLIVNTTITCVFSFKEFKSKEALEENEPIEENKKLYLFKIITILFWLMMIFLLIAHYAFKYNFISYFTLLYYFAFIWFTFKIRKKNISDLSYENKMYYLQTTFLYTVFFSSKATSVYLENFLNVSHTIKEYMLITFLIIKLLFFIFCLIVNFSIFMSNLKNIFNKRIIFIKSKIQKYLNETFELSFYNFHFSKNGKNKKRLFIDVLVYFILCPITIIINFIVLILMIFSQFLLRKILILGNKITHYLDNSSKIMAKTIKISLIFSLIIVYGIIVYNPNIILNKTKEIYNLIITVILIPLVYDSIKQK